MVDNPSKGSKGARKLVDILSFHHASKVANTKKSVFQTCNKLQVKYMESRRIE